MDLRKTCTFIHGETTLMGTMHDRPQTRQDQTRPDIRPEKLLGETERNGTTKENKKQNKTKKNTVFVSMYVRVHACMCCFALAGWLVGWFV